MSVGEWDRAGCKLFPQRFARSLVRCHHLAAARSGSATRPGASGERPCPRAGTVISCIAGVSIARITEIMRCPVTRIMPSGPETILQGRGIAAVFPSDPQVKTLLSSLGLRIFDVANEELLHWFTVGVCLPAALLAAPADAAIDAAAQALSVRLPCFNELLVWARGVTPRFASAAQAEQYISTMATPGGVTEAIVTSLRSGSTFLEALIQGHERSRAPACA